MLNVGVKICINLNLRFNAAAKSAYAGALPGEASLYVRFGSKADIGVSSRNVCFTDIRQRNCDVRFVPIADIGSITLRPGRGPHANDRTSFL